MHPSECHISCYPDLAADVYHATPLQALMSAETQEAHDILRRHLLSRGWQTLLETRINSRSTFFARTYVNVRSRNSVICYRPLEGFDRLESIEVQKPQTLHGYLRATFQVIAQYNESAGRAIFGYPTLVAEGIAAKMLMHERPMYRTYLILEKDQQQTNTTQSNYIYLLPRNGRYQSNSIRNLRRRHQGVWHYGDYQPQPGASEAPYAYVSYALNDKPRGTTASKLMAYSEAFNRGVEHSSSIDAAYGAETKHLKVQNLSADSEILNKPTNESPSKIPRALQYLYDQISSLGDKIRHHPLRIEYENKVKKLYIFQEQLIELGIRENTIANMARLGGSEAVLAEKALNARRELGIKYKDLTPRPLRDYIYEVNIQRYGDPLGPSVDFLLKQGKTYRQIIQGAARPNPNVDRLLQNYSKWLSQQSEEYLSQFVSEAT